MSLSAPAIDLPLEAHMSPLLVKGALVLGGIVVGIGLTRWFLRKIGFSS